MINAKRIDNQLKLKVDKTIEDGRYMKKKIQKATQRTRPQRRAEESIIVVCQRIHGATLGIRNSLNAFKISLVERADMDALRVIEELENLAGLARTHVIDRLVKITGSREFVDLVESPLQVNDGTDSIWTPTTWTGVHAELLTYFIQSIEICRGVLSSFGTTLDHATRHMLIQVLALFEEMLWAAEMNPPKACTALSSSGRRGNTEVQAVANIEQKFCALMMCSPNSTPEVVSGTLELSSANGGSAWFIPIGDEPRRHVRLDKLVVRQLIDVPPERQPLFQGCTHILELSAAELRGKDYFQNNS